MSRPLSIPEHGVDADDILEQMESYRSDDAQWREGKTWSMVYHVSDDHSAFLKRAHNAFFSENGLNPVAFKSLKRMESETVRMSASMLNGDEDVVGTLTSGGTESILLACKSYRDAAKKRRPWIRTPEIVAPKTIHVAFDKAAHYFGMKIRYAEIGDDYRADVRAMKKLINRNTVMLAASAPQYPHGVVDPIEELAELAHAKGLPMHVDACIGGFILPWIERLGYAVPRWDFRVPGVTSISADIHKYGYAPKGASVVLYRDMSWLKHQFFVSTNWPGGIYLSPSMPGSRPGGCISAAWAALMAMGQEGYTELARGAMDVAARLKAGIATIPGIEVVGDPHATIVTFKASQPTDGSDPVDIYAVADQIEKAGWSVDRQQHPASIHCTCNANNAAVVDEYLDTLREAVAWCQAHPEASAEGNAPMYGMMAKIPFRGMVKASVLKVMEQMYGKDAADPDLENLGGGDDDGVLLKAINKYGDQAMAALDRIERGRDALRRAFRRRRGGSS